MYVFKLNLKKKKKKKSVGVFSNVVYFLFTQFSAFWMNWVAAETAQNSCSFRDSPTTFRARVL